MWSSPGPPRNAPGDQYNDSAGANPYSRNATVPKTKPGRQSTDPWDWGWDENNSAQNDDWNNGWNQPPAPVPNVIPNPQPSLYHPNKPDSKPHGTPDLIPEKVNNRPLSRGVGMQINQSYNKSNAAEFFENIDLDGQSQQINTLPSMYNVADTGLNSRQQTHNMFQVSQQNVNTSISPASYFNQTMPGRFANSQPFYQQGQPNYSENHQQSTLKYALPQSAPSLGYQPPPSSGVNYQQLPPSTMNYQQPSTPNYQQTSISSTATYQQPPPSTTPIYQHPSPSTTPSYQQPTHSTTPNHQQTPPSTMNFQQPPPSSTPSHQQETPSPALNYQQPPPSSTQNYQQPPPSSTPKYQQTFPSSSSNYPQSSPVSAPNYQQLTSSSTSNYQPPPTFSNSNYQPPPPSSSLLYHQQNPSPSPVPNSQRPQSPATTYQQPFTPTQNYRESSPTPFLIQNQQPQASSQTIFQNTQPFQPDANSTTTYSGNYFDRAHSNYESVADQTAEVENVEVAPPEKTDTPSEFKSNQLGAARQNSSDIKSQGFTNTEETDETNIPDNQETVTDNEEQLQGLPKKLSQMKINSASHSLEPWNTPAGWENQEVAPRCELDRNQYLETGQLDSNDVEEVPLETDNNDEGEALPPPGLHRMVTGQGTESISLRSVLGQPSSLPHSNDSGFVRLVPGQQTPRDSPEPSSLERLIPGQQNHEDMISQRMVPGHYSQDDRFSSHQISQDELHRLIPGQVETEPPIGTRMILGQQRDEENNTSVNEIDRMIPGEVSEHEISFPGDVPDDERMVPGGMSDDSRSQSISIDDETRNSSERMIPGMIETNQLQPDNTTERLVTGGGRAEVDNLSNSCSALDAGRHLMTGTPETVNQPVLGLHRLVLGQTNNANSEPLTGKQAERGEEKQGGMHRMVVGQFREKEVENENEKEKETEKQDDKENDSDSDSRSYRRRHRHRRDSYGDERKERDYSSERDYRSLREDRREYRKKRDNTYNRSPEYRSDHEEFERTDYRDRRERDKDRRDRPKDRRRRSPDYSYDPYYRDDPRKLHPRDRDRRYYEPYEDDYYYRENRSRPSSRSGSEYRRHRDYPTRHPYYPEPGGHYMQYYQMQQYYENMRRTDPVGYAQWYEQFMAEKYGTASNDRASVHSGRSSANENSQIQEKKCSVPHLVSSTPFGSPWFIRNPYSVMNLTKTIHMSKSMPTFSSSNDCFKSHKEPMICEEDQEAIKPDDAVSHRSTPPLYTSAHIRGDFNSLGQLIVVNPHDPFSYGEHQPTVTLCKISGPNAADSSDLLEFHQNPGPFISGVTHKNTVLQYLKKQSDQITHSSGKLLYDLIRLVIKLNGVVDMTDVADLLMESYHSCKTEEDDFSEPSPAVDDSPPLSPRQVTSKFRQLLLEGNKNEALEWAMKNKDWGHALFLASKMDSRIHNNVMLRFANGLQNNDPLQTLYQLMSGREPQAATCAADKKWGDWRPHLAMMLSNRTSNIEMDRKAILTLGDSLGGRGRLFAAHFCYLTAQLEFSHYSDRHAKLVLLGASPDLPFSQFATCRAIMLTLCYEYAKQLSNKEWCIPSLRPYKWLMACRLYDHGNMSGAMLYLEALAEELVRLPHRDDAPLTQLIIDMADKLKVADDTTLAYITDPSSDPDWLARLKAHADQTNDPNYLSTHMTHGISTSTVSDLEVYNGGEHVAQQPTVQDSIPAYSQDINNYSSEPYNGSYQQDHGYDPTPNEYYNPAQSIPAQDMQQQVSQGYNSATDGTSIDYWSANAPSSWDQQQQLVSSRSQEDQQPDTIPQPQPQISVKPSFGYFANYEDNIKPQVDNKPTASATAEETPQNREKSTRRSNKTQQSGSGWFGGIWDKLALRPKNQMILPDDKDPSIVWDEKTKKWVNTDASGEEQSVELKPPPRASELSDSAPVSGPPALGSAPATNPGLPPPATTTNKYKLQRGKGMRGNYVDVMASSKTTTSTANPQPFVPMPQAPATNFFVPAPVPGNENASLDFLSPSGPVSYEPSSKSDDQPPQLSRSSSASSLSREVTYYMSRRPSYHRRVGYGKGNPAFYNPKSYKS